MGNALGGKRSVKIMNIKGETLKLKTPVQAGSVLAKHPGHMLVASEAVVHLGARAKPLEPHDDLKPRRLYFLVEQPKLRRVQSGVHMTAKERLESLMLSRRSASDISAAPRLRVRLRLPKAEVERLMADVDDGADVADKIVGLCMAAGDTADRLLPRQLGTNKSREKRVGFSPIDEGEIQLAVAS